MITAPVSNQTISTNSNATSSASSTSSLNSMSNYNSFLQLLVSELKNQDPTKPMDPTQTLTQLATFSGVQQAVETNSLLGAMVVNSGLSQAAGIVGKTLTPADGSASGVISSVTLSSSNGLTANLKDGRSVPLASGASIS